MMFKVIKVGLVVKDLSRVYEIMNSIFIASIVNNNKKIVST
jgi:hypothetical protein